VEYNIIFLKHLACSVYNFVASVCILIDLQVQYSWKSTYFSYNFWFRRR